jgi:hypothetical protein
MVDLHGPWNLECIREAHQKAAPLMEEMHRDGPWGIVVLVHDSMLGTADAIQSFRKDVAQVRKLGRVGVAWVVDPATEGRAVMEPIIEGIYKGVFPVQFFTALPDGKRWIQELIDSAQ